MEQAQGAPANSSNNKGKLAVTVRTLEGLIRIATAHAKLKLQLKVLTEDVEEAYKLMLEAREEKLPVAADGLDPLGDETIDLEEGAEPPAKRARRASPEGAASEDRLRAVQTLVGTIFAR